MFKSHQLVVGNNSLMMFRRVVFLLYLPAICFSFALFPSDGHETQRRQNSEENMVNATVIQVEMCHAELTPCMENLRPLHATGGLGGIVVAGTLTIPCESYIREESWNCIDSVSHCSHNGLYQDIRSSLMSWDFICQNSAAFVAGEDCWSTSQIEPEFLNCLASLTNVCMAPCLHEAVTKVPACSLDDVNLFGLLVATNLPEGQSSC